MKIKNEIPNTSKDKKYNKIKIKVSVISAVYNFGLLAILAFSGISYLVYDVAKMILGTPNEYLVFLLFVAIVAVLFSLLTLPLDFYSSFTLEHRFSLSNQTVLSWIGDYIKSSVLTAVIGLIIAFLFYFFLRFSNNYWWVYFGLCMFLIIVVLAQVTPLFILPLFYQFKSIDDEQVSKKIIDLLKKQHISINGIYSFNMSKETKKANAAFTGLGKGRRIIISDTLLHNFTPDEIAVIFAHEMGHYKKKHILKNLLITTALIFLSSFVCNLLYQYTLTVSEFRSIYEIPAIPILIFYIAVFSIIVVPVINIISRKFEKNADMFALALTSNKKAFISSMEKLAEINLVDKSPHPLIEFFFYSHPSISRRIEFAQNYFKKDIDFSNE